MDDLFEGTGLSPPPQCIDCGKHGEVVDPIPTPSSDPRRAAEHDLRGKLVLKRGEVTCVPCFQKRVDEHEKRRVTRGGGDII